MRFWTPRGTQRLRDRRSTCARRRAPDPVAQPGGPLRVPVGEALRAGSEVPCERFPGYERVSDPSGVYCQPTARTAEPDRALFECDERLEFHDLSANRRFKARFRLEVR